VSPSGSSAPSEGTGDGQPEGGGVEEVSDRIWTIPNIISLVRLALIPVFVWLLAIDEPVAAGLLFVVIGSTDWVDGYLARRLNQVTKLGKALDPVADRLAVVAALIGGLITGYVPAAYALAVLLREVVVGLAVIYGDRKGIRLEVSYVGKLATFLVYGALASFMVGIGGDIALFEIAGWVAGTIGLVFYYWAGFQYLAQLRQELAARR
jgi:cardiolipin synthase